tara:strand:- start:96 stop:821 length:726 start_codon:yes stop_codon:yes gene_type:complete
MEKTKLVKVIEKYHLSKLIDKGCWNIKDNVLKINFNSPNKDLVGFLTTDIQLEDADIGIFDTEQLLSLVNITDETLLLSFKKVGDMPSQLNIEDNNFSLLYSLSDTTLIEKINSVNEPSTPITTIDIQTEFIVNYLRAKKALTKEERINIQLGTNDQDEKVARFVLGSHTTYSNSIRFEVYCDFENTMSEAIAFNANLLKELLAVNKNAETIKLTLWKEGMIKIETMEEGVGVEYFLVGLQ